MLILNGKDFSVAKNLECAVRHLRDKEAPRVLWVGAIWINQQDNNERSKQVASKGRIFNRATTVCAWLGKASYSSHCVFDALQRYQARRSEIFVPAHYDAAEQLHCYRQLFCDIFQETAENLPQKTYRNDDALYEEFNWLRPLFDRCYWRRIWVVQELILAKGVVSTVGTSASALKTHKGSASTGVRLSRGLRQRIIGRSNHMCRAEITFKLFVDIDDAKSQAGAWSGKAS